VLVLVGAHAIVASPAPPFQLPAPEPAGLSPTVRIGVLKGREHVVSTHALEPYVAAVLGGEAAPNTPAAALEALAVAVRTYTVANMGRHRADGFDLCDQTHCQVMRAATAATEAAARATAGQILWRGGAPAAIYYSASCGGHTEKPSAVWPGSEDPPHLPARADDACDGWPAWSAELTRGDVQRALEAGGFRGRLADLRVVSRNSSGRVAQLAVDGMTPREISGQTLRAVVGNTLGWQRVLSAAFELRRNGDVFRFTGKGWGHGVGMCVIGSMRLAEVGEGSAAILRRYFPGLTIAPVKALPVQTAAAPTSSAPRPDSQPPVATPRNAAAVVAPSSNVLPEGDGIDRLATAARDDLARVLGISASPPVPVRVHASAAEFELATGAPSYALSAVVGAELHFIPADALRRRGVLDRAVRRAVVRLLTGEALQGRPRWVAEGAASYFADAAGGDAPTSGPCPADVELEQPISAGALSDARARARGCFARQIASGRRWQDVK
jgi:SpoIID/LytB domain protein